MQKKKLFYTLAITAMLSLSVTACGSNESGEDFNIDVSTEVQSEGNASKDELEDTNSTKFNVDVGYYYLTKSGKIDETVNSYTLENVGDTVELELKEFEGYVLVDVVHTMDDYVSSIITRDESVVYNIPSLPTPYSPITAVTIQLDKEPEKNKSVLINLKYTEIHDNYLVEAGEQLTEPTEATEPTEVELQPGAATVFTDDYFTLNGLKVNGEGGYKFTALTNIYTDYNEEVFYDKDVSVAFASDEVGNGDGTKTVNMSLNVETLDGSENFTNFTTFLVDRYTGKLITTFLYEQPENFSITLDDGTVVDMKVECSRESKKVKEETDETSTTGTSGATGTGTYMGYTESYTVTIPDNYDGLVVGIVTYAKYPVHYEFQNQLTGEWSEDVEASKMKYYNYDTLYFAEIPGVGAEVKVFDDYFSKNDIRVNGVGDYRFLAEAQHFTSDTDYTIQLVNMSGNFDVSEVDNGDGTKTISASIKQYPYYFYDRAWSCGYSYTFVADRYTGAAFIPSNNTEGTFQVTMQDGTIADITVTRVQENASEENNYMVTQNFTVIVPSDYDGLVFGRTGVSAENANAVKFGEATTIPELLSGDGKIIYFAK